MSSNIILKFRYVLKEDIINSLVNLGFEQKNQLVFVGLSLKYYPTLTQFKKYKCASISIESNEGFLYYHHLISTDYIFIKYENIDDVKQFIQNMLNDFRSFNE